jgi:methylphosphotriester-DNA--protein-cysteine methyltransferase
MLCGNGGPANAGSLFFDAQSCLNPKAVAIDDKIGVVIGTVIGAQSECAPCRRDLRNAGRPYGRRAPSWLDERRISATLRRIEPHADQVLSLSDLTSAAMSSYHFLCTFRAVVGMSRISSSSIQGFAARRPSCTSPPTAFSSIAFAAGFGDLSTFNRRFQRIMGVSQRPQRAPIVVPTRR